MSRVLFLQDEYDEGYSKGLSHANSGKKKQPFSLISKEGIKYATGITNREQYHKSFIQGYDTGYSDGLRIKSVKKEFKKEKQETMSEESNIEKRRLDNKAQRNSYDNQIFIMESLKNDLISLQNKANEISLKYKRALDEIEGEIFQDEYAKILDEGYLELKKKINYFTDLLESHDIRKANEIISTLEEMKDKI